MAKPNTHLVWQGASLLDGAPIGVFVTLKSENEKTGNMVQATILRLDVHPVVAVREGLDYAICGDCKHRGVPRTEAPTRKKSIWSLFQNRTCYVQVGKGPASIYNAYKRGNIPATRLAVVAGMIAGRNIRLGAYGDPAAVPTSVWQVLTRAANRWTGYTHQWRNAGLQAFVMASVDNASEYDEARAMGYRTFRVKGASDAPMSREITCPASEEAGYKTECNRCTLCDGARANDNRATIVINAHGAGAGSFVSLTSMRKAA